MKFTIYGAGKCRASGNLWILRSQLFVNHSNSDIVSYSLTPFDGDLVLSIL